MGSNVMAVFLDEYLFMNPKAFPSIFPTTATGALLVMTSSMSPDGASTAMRLIDVRNDDGTPVVTKYNWVQACVDCQRKGCAEKCNHFIAPPQHFQNFASQSRLAKLMSGIEGAYEREMQNICDEPTHRPAFDSAQLDYMARNHQRLKSDQRHLFITIDPSCGKNGNLYVITSAVFSKLDGICTVCRPPPLLLLHTARLL
jgi:hypothetical protein